MRTWADVAVLAKTKNLKGRFVARAAAGLPFLLEEGVEVAFAPPRLDAPRCAVVSRVASIDDCTAEIEFEGIDGEAAALLAGCHCLVKRADIDETTFETHAAAWDGWMVVDELEGEIGIVADLVENPSQQLLIVERPAGKPVYVPVVEEIISDVDPDGKVVRVKLPSGLLDL